MFSLKILLLVCVGIEMYLRARSSDLVVEMDTSIAHFSVFIISFLCIKSKFKKGFRYNTMLVDCTAAEFITYVCVGSRCLCVVSM